MESNSFCTRLLSGSYAWVVVAGEWEWLRKGLPRGSSKKGAKPFLEGSLNDIYKSSTLTLYNRTRITQDLAANPRTAPAASPSGLKGRWPKLSHKAASSRKSFPTKLRDIAVPKSV